MCACWQTQVVLVVWAVRGRMKGKRLIEGVGKKWCGIYLGFSDVLCSVGIKPGWLEVLQGSCGGASHSNSVIASRRLQLRCSALMLWSTKGLGSSHSLCSACALPCSSCPCRLPFCVCLFLLLSAGKCWETTGARDGVIEFVCPQ